MKSIIHFHRSQEGSAGMKFMFVLLILALVGNAGLNYVPVAYDGESFKSEMQTAVVNGMALPSSVQKPLDSVKKRLERAAADNNVPSDALLEVHQVGGAIQAHASYSKEVGILPFGLYTYTYRFDHTATPTGFLLKDS
jgi:hypothetical protein